MDTFQMAAQAVGLFAMAFNILSYQQKTRKGAIAFQLMGSFLFSVNFFMLGAMVGGILNAVGIVRALVFLNKEKLHADRLPWLVGFTVAYVVSYILTFTVFGKQLTPVNMLIELLPVVGMIATTISFRLTEARDIRRYGLISSPSWLVYNIVNVSVGAIICEVISLCSILIGMYRFDRGTGKAEEK